jgi:hypothetical protein
MSRAQPQAPDTSAEHVGRGLIDGTVMMAAPTGGSHHRYTCMVGSAKSPLVRHTDGRTTDRRIGADGTHNAQRRIGHCRPARSSLVGDRS